VTRTRTTRFARRAALTAAALSLPLALGACGTPEAGSAAVVGNRRISVYEVQRATADIQAYFPDQPVAQQQVLFFLISGPYIVDAAAQAGVGVSANDARTQLSTKLPLPSDPGVEVFQANEAITNISNLEATKQQAALASIKAAIVHDKVALNPRYGSFDTTQLKIVAAQQNWMVTPSPSPSVDPNANPAPEPSPSAS
jgi:hypothetical protein